MAWRYKQNIGQGAAITIVNNSMSAAASVTKSKKVFSGDDTTKVFTLDENYVSGSLEIWIPGVVDRLHLDDSDTTNMSDRFKYTETGDAEITLNMAIPTGAEMIVYYDPAN